MTSFIEQIAGAIPVLTTQRLILRAPRLSDFEAFAAFYDRPRSAFLGGPMSRHDAWDQFSSTTGQWLLRGYGYWEIQDVASAATIGRAGVFHPDDWIGPELSWILYSDDVEGRGIAQEAALAARDGAARHFGLTGLMSSIEASNTRSARLAERMGAVRDGAWNTPYGPMDIYRHPKGDA